MTIRLPFLVLCAMVAAVAGESATAPQVAAAWSRATAPSAKAAGIFATIRGGAADDAIVAGSSPAAAAVELHTVIAGADGVRRMQPVERIAIPAGGEVVLKPGDLHIMLMGLHGPLAEGQSVAVELRLASGGVLAVQAAVAGPGAMAPPAAISTPSR